ncbi:MAG: hypothetical protein ACPGVU_04870 [Limisphaerales bacterium]
MTKPLALLAYERMIPGSQVLVKLGDLGYRTEQLDDLGKMIRVAEETKPLVIVIDLEWRTRDPFLSINSLVQNPGTAHVPIIAFADMESEDRLEKALNMGAALVTGTEGVLPQLPQLLEQALQVD